MKNSLLKEACSKFFAGVILVFLLLFVPAGSLRYPGGWRLIAVLFVPMFAAGLIMWKKAPDLLAKRLQAKEKESEQIVVIALSGLMFVGGFVAAGLDFRRGWTTVPPGTAWCAVGVFLLGYLLFGEVLRENAYLSRTVEVQQDQQVIDTGLYGVVRHPMYTATLLMFLSIPFILESWVSFRFFLLYPVFLVIRIRNEEAVLRAGLEGYEDYCERVRWRLIPFLW